MELNKEQFFPSPLIDSQQDQDFLVDNSAQLMVAYLVDLVIPKVIVGD
jgi:hypothetical protein